MRTAAILISLALIGYSWHKDQQDRIHHAIQIRVDEGTDGEIQQAIDEVSELYNLSEEDKEQLYRAYYVGGGEE